MKGLHALADPFAATGLAWYAAVQNRAGRRHLLRVQAIFVPLDRLRVPRWAQQNEWRRERWLSDQRELHMPNTVAVDRNPERLCTTNQRVTSWRYDPNWHPQRQPAEDTSAPRGFCGACWELLKTEETFAQFDHTRQNATYDHSLGRDYDRQRTYVLNRHLGLGNW